MRAASCCNVYKALVLVIVVLIAMEYFFGTTIEYKRWERWGDVFLNNYTNSKSSDTFHSPLIIKTLLNHKKNDTEFVSSLPAVRELNNIGINSTTSIGITEELQNLNVTVPNTMNFGNNSVDLPLCPDNPPDLGNVIKVLKTSPPSVLELEARFSWLEMGGHGHPVSCRAPSRVAIVVPFRCRAEHLLLFLQHMHPFLRRQQIDYRIFVVEQDSNGAFNRAALMNVGFVEALKTVPFDCFIFHDIDLLPEDERNLYTCPEMPRHMSVAVDVFGYSLPYKDIFGGVNAISTKHFKLLNGFSNSFWGWGGEDDDMSNRIRYHSLYISRYPKTIAKYTMLTHKKEKANPDRYEALKLGKLKYDSDGLSNLQYTLLQRKENKLYTWILVHVGPPR